MILSERSRQLAIKCSNCHDQCMSYTPELKFLPNQAILTSRRAQLLDFIDRGIAKIDEDVAAIIYSSLNTGLQKYNCIFRDGVDETEYIREFRAHLAESGVLPESIKLLFENARNGSIYKEDASNLPKVAGTGSVALVFDGASRLFAPKARNAACAIFNTFEDAGVILDIASCGYTEWDLGFMEESNRATEQLINLLHLHGIQLVVSTDPAVIAMLRKSGYAESIHFSQYITRKKVALTEKQFSNGVVYHDSSIMARSLHITEEPRAILQKIAGSSYKEFFFHHEQAKPTGGGFGYLLHKDSLKLADERIQEAKQVGANVIIASSPFSYHNLKESCKDMDITVIDFAEFVADSIQEVADICPIVR